MKKVTVVPPAICDPLHIRTNELYAECPRSSDTGVRGLVSHMSQGSSRPLSTVSSRRPQHYLVVVDGEIVCWIVDFEEEASRKLLMVDDQPYRPQGQFPVCGNPLRIYPGVRDQSDTVENVLVTGSIISERDAPLLRLVDEIAQVLDGRSGGGRIHHLLRLVNHHIRVPEVLVDKLVGVKVVVWNVQNMLRLASPRIAGTIAPYVHASLLSQPGSICHRERLPYPVLQQSPIPAAAADLVDAHVDKGKGGH